MDQEVGVEVGEGLEFGVGVVEASRVRGRDLAQRILVRGGGRREVRPEGKISIRRRNWERKWMVVRAFLLRLRDVHFCTVDQSTQKGDPEIGEGKEGRETEVRPDLLPRPATKTLTQTWDRTGPPVTTVSEWGRTQTRN